MSTVNPAAPVSCRDGAPMGRSNFGDTFDVMRPLHLVRLPLDSGGYDSGGAYWGHGVPLYAVHDTAGGFYRTFRGRSREAVKAELREGYPSAWFYGERNPVRCYDNGGATVDRYTAVYMDKPGQQPNTFESFGMSADPFHPQGFWKPGAAMDGPHLGKRIRFSDLPADCQRLVYQDRQP